MAKPKQKLTFRLPEYVSPRNAWRKKIHAAALKAANDQGVEYGPEVKLAVEVKLYLRGRALEIHDVDNRSKAEIGHHRDQLISIEGHSRMRSSCRERSLRRMEPRTPRVESGQN